MIIDFHTHIFPNRIVKQAMQSLSSSSGEYRPYTNGTYDGLIQSMDAANIDCSCIANIATKPEQAKAIHKWSMNIRSERIIPLGSIHPQSHNWEEELELFARDNFVGIKLHPLYQNFTIDAKELYPMYKKIDQLGMFILIHSGYDIAFPGDEKAHPKRIATIHKDFPNLKIVAAHMGGWHHWNAALEHLAGKDIFFDTSFIDEINKDVLTSILKLHPANFLLFASDSPWTDQSDHLQKLINCGFNTDELELICFQNSKMLI